MKAAGFSFLYPTAMSVAIFGGSMEFVTVDLLQQAFNPLGACLLTLMVQARHLFYGVSMLDKYQHMGPKKIYLIYGLCDESFSINCGTTVPDGVDCGWFYFFVTLLNQSYWVAGATLGGLFGTLLQIHAEGLDFMMTALLVVIFLNNWMQERKHTGSLIGLGATLVCLLLFGSSRFLIPSMICILLLLTLLRPYLEKAVTME